MLKVVDEWERRTATQTKMVWDEFMRSGTSHSGNATTLPYVINRCEQEGIPYKLEAAPGMGYRLERIEL